MIRRIWTTVILAFIMAPSALAQFYVTGTEPGTVKWKQISTENYRLLYPEGLDSLANVYAVKLEQYRTLTAETCGFLTNQEYSTKMPVLFHPYSSTSNASVVWTPRRMEIMTVPDPLSPDPMSWEDILAVHEGRHVAHMQYVNSGKFKILGKLTGELAAGALAALYCGPAIFEGDAVKTETDLVYGRGKTADFLNYYKVAFANGDMRDFYRWRFGSQKYYTPDYYRAGYLFFSGMEDLYGVKDFTKRYNHKLLVEEKGFLPLGITNKTSQDISGKKFRQTFDDIALFYKYKWQLEAEARGPFMPSDRVSPSTEFFSSYDNLFLVRDTLLSTVSSLTSATRLEGRAFKSGTSRIKFSESTEKMYWSEIIPDRRWEQVQYSIIRSKKPGEKDIRNISSEGRLFNPTPSDDGTSLAVTNYPFKGGSSIDVINSSTGETQESFPSPDGLQVVESAWIGNDIYVTGVCSRGMGIYNATDGFKEILAPGQAKIKQLWSDGACLYFTADWTSTNELYELDPGDGTILQITNTEFGADNFVPLGDSLYYTAMTVDGKAIFRTHVADLPIKEVDSLRYHSPSELSTASGDVAISAPEDYDKTKNLFKLHSWLPLYVNYNEIESISLENVWSVAGLGATGFFQNELGTLYGSAGIGLLPWQCAFAKATYRGFYPVIDAEINLGKNISSGYLQTYVPLNFSSGGWRRGIIPRVSLQWTGGEGANLATSLRAYSVLPVADSRIYPEWGIGGEIGAVIGADRVYGSFYGYLPGFSEQHGVRLAAQIQAWSPVENHAVGTLDAKYAMPLLSVDWSGLSPFAYIRNFELIMDALVNTNGYGRLGASFSARLENLVWIPFTSRVGISAAYDGEVSLGLSLSVDI